MVTSVRFLEISESNILIHWAQPQEGYFICFYIIWIFICGWTASYKRQKWQLAKQNNINLDWNHKLNHCSIFRFWHLFSSCVNQCGSNPSKATQLPQFLLSPYPVPWRVFALSSTLQKLASAPSKAQLRTAGGVWHFDWDILPLITCKFQHSDMNWAGRLYFYSPSLRSFSPLCYSTRDAIYYIMASVCIQWLRQHFNKGTSLSVLWAGLSA